MAPEKLPRWDLTNVYPGLDSAELTADISRLQALIDTIESHHASRLSATTVDAPAAEVGSCLDRAVVLFNAAYQLSGTLFIYIESFVTTDSYNSAAAKQLSQLEILNVGLRQAWTMFQKWLTSMAEVLPRSLETAGPAREHAFILRETAEQGAFLMSGPEEMLAADLSLSGANAWNKLQRTLTSQIGAEIELDGATRTLPMPALINLRSHPEEPVRRRAYEAEMVEWEKVKEPLAACMNGVKGSAVVLNGKRGRTDCLHAPIDQARIDRPTLSALLGAMEASLPSFRRYFAAKAARLGKQKLAWWDLFAPTGRTTSSFTWGAARELILANFGSFSPRLRDFARRAFDHNWIDAEPRDGKQGGAFCSAVPGVKESRILANFDGSLEQVSTIAHELGHGFHNDCAYRAGKTELQQATPMTLAETASIMCETIVNHALLEKAADPQEQLAILESALINDSQIIVDIYSRYLFEKELMERRERSELSADELCDIMDRAQAAAYGDALDERFRHRYMWTWKPHYYSPGLDFYNFPYAFGLLFGTGLYALSRSRGPGFAAEYEALLASTGEAPAADLASGFGIDIRTRAFWDRSLSLIGERIERYCNIPHVTVSAP
jgi:pepF/M3 family oligoendopeptidase